MSLSCIFRSFYSSITDYLGFAINEGEYKVMGLASFGDPNSKSAKLVRLMDWDSTSNNLISDMSYLITTYQQLIQ